MNKTTCAGVASKILIVFFYFVLIGCFIFSPRIIQYVYTGDRSINVYTFAGLFSFDVIKAFEEKYGVKVSVKFFDSNEELFAKFKIGGGQGYDVITPSDYMVELMRKEDFLHKLDHDKFPVMKYLDKRIVGRYFDPENNYSLPLAWIPYGLLFNKKVFKHQPKQVSLEMMFKDPKILADSGMVTFPYKISMKDDCREAILLTSLYRFGEMCNITPQRLKEVLRILVEQKQWVENYLHQDVGYFFLADIIHVAITDSSYAKKIMEESSDFDFIIPKEGSFVYIENMAIPKNSTKIDLAYKFINFVLSKQQSLENTKAYGLNPSNTQVYPLVEKKFLNNPNFFPDKEIFAKLHLMHNNLSVKQFERVWLEVKGA